MGAMDSDYDRAAAAFRAWCGQHGYSLLTDAHTHALGHLANAALGEADAEIARLRCELDRYLGRQVIHTTAANAAALASVPATTTDPPGTILRATDTGDEWELAPSGFWLPRA